ncbi:MAG: HNH endonuclease [Phenylobacterium sp.]|uniref:HNH endonuclease n=1 Tax=Phenylobacterium sp. TaxID=1871053 RepID=UPI0011FEC167|nr:HNH endonuclease [Phenylobacterium sp.]TAL32267.1 MAG: HNH endonuclease [Phenylobacterium sp.]
MTCLFCDNKLDAATKPEHVLLNALGGRKTSKKLICSVCNNEFGGSIDAALANQVPLLRNLLQLYSGTGKPPPTIKGVKAGDEVVDFLPNGTADSRASPFRIIREDEGIRLEVDVRSPEHLAEMIPHIAAQVKMPEDRVRQLLPDGEARAIQRRVGSMHGRFSFGGELAIRSMVKACLEITALAVGNDVTRSTPFDLARSFVNVGSETFVRERTHLDDRLLPNVAQLIELYGTAFNLVCVRSDEHGRVLGHFTLYNMLAWQVVLAEEGGPPNLQLALVSDPMNQANWSEEPSVIDDVSWAWLASPSHADFATVMPQRVGAILKLANDIGTSRAIERIVGDVFERHGVSGDVVVEDEAMKEAILSEAIHRAAHLLLKVPLEQVVSQDELARWLANPSADENAG